MGHSDSTPFHELLSSDESAHFPPADVRVWGDMSHIEAWRPDAARETAVSQGCALANAPEERLAPASIQSQEDLYRRIGRLTRILHDAMRELGHHDLLADCRDHLPEARDRLGDVARLTGEAAEKVLNCVDRARLLQDGVAQLAQALCTRWASGAARTAGEGRTAHPDKTLAEDTCEFLAALQKRTELTNAILTDIMVAQDFHDRTAQVIRKVAHLAQTLEEQLVKLLVDANPGEGRVGNGATHRGGTVTLPQARGDVITDQAGVDALLASLGF
ncbi:MAG TPA: protein phosphatase CheZ [Burkholderiaceae bacterium]|nr:protein phosphatase CheZ [Burkholderiaceae bacterium]